MAMEFVCSLHWQTVCSVLLGSWLQEWTIAKMELLDMRKQMRDAANNLGQASNFNCNCLPVKLGFIDSCTWMFHIQICRPAHDMALGY